MPPGAAAARCSPRRAWWRLQPAAGACSGGGLPGGVEGSPVEDEPAVGDLAVGDGDALGAGRARDRPGLGVADTAPGPAARYRATEAVELAFIAALQRLPPRQAAALVMHDVLGFATGEVAALLSTSQPAVKGAVQRARAALRERAGGARPAAPGSARERDLSRRFASAYVAGDVDGVVALLSDDAWLTMPPAPHEYHGPAAIAAFLCASFGWRGARRVQLVATRANTQPAFGSYLSDSASDGGRPVATPAGLIVLTAAGGRLQAVTRFHLAAIYPRFGLPASLPGAPARSRP